MTYYAHPECVQKGQLLWLELEEFESRPKVAVRVRSVIPRARRAHVWLIGAAEYVAVSVDYGRLWEEVNE